MKEIQMDYYDKDSSASAVILSDYGYFNGDEFKFTRHVRIKILKKEGLHFGNWTLQTPSKGSFKGVVYNFENGSIEEEKLAESKVHKQQIIDDLYVYKVFMPNVKVGSIIDLRYSFYGMPYEWRFQYLIPVIYSELKIDPNDYLRYNKQFYGFEEFKLVGQDHWISRDIPAFIKEEKISHYSNYISKIELNLLEVRYPGSRYSRPYFKEYATSWEQIGKNLYEHEFFGRKIRETTFINKKAKEIKEASASNIEIINKVYNYVKSNIKWNDIHTIYSLGTIRDNFEDDKSGSISEINLTLIAMLGRAGIDVWPVVLSTIDNGMLLPHSPSMNKLNYVIAYIEIDGKGMLLDASQQNLQPGILPVKCLNGPAWLVEHHGGRWIDLIGKNKNTIRKFTKISTNENEEWIAEVSIMRNKYAYLSWKEENSKNYSTQEYLSQFENGNNNLFINEYNIIKDDSIKLNSTEQLKIELEDFLVDLGSEFIMDPYLIKEINENSFKSVNRKYPVFFSTIPSIKHTVIIDIPETIKVRELPESIKMSLPDQSGYFSFVCSESNGSIQINYSIQLKRALYNEEEYHMLKNFYTEVLKKIGQPILFIKST
ncbi:MAG: DUF3858 domain-containing protein [Reichenbachiella sp.]|uniref:DUF3858 domain-containing protein n=1 Tax=Reichenbachiella sp. TaxID=2184521 RepID=UPI003264D0ED